MKTLLTSSLAILLLSGCSRPDAEQWTAGPALLPAKVQLATVTSEQVPLVTEVTGVVRPAQRAQLAAKVMGTIEELPVTLGQSVKSGDLLVKINAGEIAARLAQAQSQLNAARRDLDRERSLLTKSASTADMVHGLEDRFAAAQAVVNEAQTMQRYTEVRAPFDGVVARKLVNAGDLASPGVPLLELEGTADYQVEAAIPESLVAGLSIGMAVEVEIGDGVGRAGRASPPSIRGALTELSSAADASALTVLAKISIPAGLPVRSGQFARVQIAGPATAAILVPQAAVSRLGQMQRVFVAGDGNRAVLRLVKTGAVRGELVEVTAGIDPNERIVVTPPVGLREGRPLEVVP